jgi:hypothetical protein
MKTRLLLLLLPTVGCHPWFIQQPTAADAGPPETDVGDASSSERDTGTATPESTSVPDAVESDALPPFADPGAGQGGATPFLGMVPPDQQARAVAALVDEPGWGTGVDASSSPPVESQLPAPGPLDGALALARALLPAMGPKGCGEPPLCFQAGSNLCVCGSPPRRRYPPKTRFESSGSRRHALALVPRRHTQKGPQS